MKIAILSDLHIKQNDGSDKFIWNDNQFNNYLNNLIDQVDRVYFNGDIFELWKTKLPTFKYQITEFSEIKKQYPHTLRTIFQHPKVVTIVGNHDAAANRLNEFFPEFNKYKFSDTIINSKGQIINIWHGHLDFWNRVLPYTGFLLTWITGIFERTFFKNASDYRSFSKSLKQQFFKNTSQIKNFKFEIDTYDNLVCMINGHTHSDQIKKFDYNGKERLYINTGYFNGSSRNIVILDTETLETCIYSSPNI